MRNSLFYVLTPTVEDKKQTDDPNQTHRIPLKSTPFLPEPRSEKCHFRQRLLRSNEPYCPFDQSGVAVAGATNVTNMRRREAVTGSLFFPPIHPHAIYPTASTHGQFVLSPVSLASRDQDGGPSNLTINIYDLTE